MVRIAMKFRLFPKLGLDTFRIARLISVALVISLVYPPSSYSTSGTPTVLNVTSSTSDSDSKTVGEVISISVQFSETVTVAGGTPRLLLETGATDRYANLVSGSGTTTLVFEYTVSSGDSSSALDYVNSSAIDLNSSTIKSDSKVQVNLVGYAQKTGTRDDLRLSLDRAIEVKKAILKIAPKVKVTTYGGGTKKVSQCKKYQNRCVVINVKKG